MGFFSDLGNAISSVGRSISESFSRGVSRNRVGGLAGTRQGDGFKSIDIDAVDTAQRLGRNVDNSSSDSDHQRTMRDINRQIRGDGSIGDNIFGGSANREINRNIQRSAIQRQREAQQRSGSSDGGDRGRTPGVRTGAPRGTPMNVSGRIQMVGRGRAVSERVAPLSTPATGQRRAAASRFARRVGASNQGNTARGILIPVAQTARALKVVTGR